MKSLAEKLDDIFLDYFYPETYCGKPRCEKCKKTKDYMDDAKNKLISLFMECVPERRAFSDTKELEGFESCRTETLKKMEELRK